MNLQTKRATDAANQALTAPLDPLLKDALDDALAPRQHTERIEMGNARSTRESSGSGSGTTDPKVRGTHLHEHELYDDLRGTAVVVNGTSYEGGVNDTGSFGQAYLGYKQEHPDWDEVTLLTMASREDINPGGDISVARGKNANGRSGRKLAALVGNDHYASYPDLSGAVSDATEMNAQLLSEGYKTATAYDVGAERIRAMFTAVASFAQPGDEVTLYFAGHGIEGGLTGVGCTEFYEASDFGPLRRFRDIVEADFLGSLAAKAVSGGWHLRIIADCCESGGIADAVTFALEQYTRRVKTTELDIHLSEIADKGIPHSDGRLKGSGVNNVAKTVMEEVD